MATNTKKPPIKETVGAQYFCFATEGDFNGTYTTEVEKTETVKTVTVSENSESSPIYGSGKVYKTNSSTSSSEISVETIAFDPITLSKARGDTVTESGLILSGASKKERPFFAYGKVVLYSEGKYKFNWYPKCQLISNSDETKTKEGSFSEQNDTITISALPFDDDGNIDVTIYSEMCKLVGITEDKFFAQPILTEEEFKAIGTLTVNKAMQGVK